MPRRRIRYIITIYGGFRIQTCLKHLIQYLNSHIIFYLPPVISLLALVLLRIPIAFALGDSV